MSAYRFHPRAIEQVDDHWRPLDCALARWTLVHGGSDLLARCAARCSHAEGEGHTAVVLSPDEAAAIAGEVLVGSGERTTAFVLDGDGRFQLWRNFQAEREAALALGARSGGDHEEMPAAIDAVAQLFGLDDPEHAAQQREAVRRAPAHRLIVLTGGPGTGKTTTVVRMLLMMLHVAGAARSIRVAAPTGKAAQRLVQAMNRGLRDLRARTDARWDDAFARMPKPEALTLHRLLGYDPRRNRYAHDERHPLAADIVVVDEASMMDLAQAQSLLASIRPQATLILVGDPDQLTSVAAGAALMDVVTALREQGSPRLVELAHVFRAERHLVSVNEAVRAGDAAAFAAAMAASPSDLAWHAIGTRKSLERALRGWADDLIALLRAARVTERHSTDRAQAVLEAIAGMQLLCALRETPFGALAADRMIASHVRRALQPDADAPWFPGRMLLVTRNDPAKQLFNGDVGVALRDDEGELRVWFEVPGDDGRMTARGFAPNALPDHEGAYAITIHKSQGSEYSRVALLLPPDPDHRVISRQLLYTGVSRAKQSLAIWGLPEVVAAALARPVARNGGFAQRLRSAIKAESRA